MLIVSGSTVLIRSILNNAAPTIIVYIALSLLLGARGLRILLKHKVLVLCSVVQNDFLTSADAPLCRIRLVFLDSLQSRGVMVVLIR